MPLHFWIVVSVGRANELLELGMPEAEVDTNVVVGPTTKLLGKLNGEVAAEIEEKNPEDEDVRVLLDPEPRLGPLEDVA